MKKLTFIFALILLGTGVLVAQSNFHNIHYLDPYNPEYVKGEVLVKFNDEVKVESSMKSGVAKTGISSVDAILEPYQAEAFTKVFKETREQRSRKTVRTIRDFKGNEIEVPALFNIYKLKVDTIWDAKQIIEELQKDENIEFAEPNYLVYSNEIMENGILPDFPPKFTPLPSNKGNRDPYPNDPLYQDGSQWYLDAIDAPAVWDSVTGDTTQIIAIIDTGVDWDHPDLDDNIWTNWNEIPDNGIDDDNNGYIDDTRGWDYINNDNDPNDDNSHGTHVAGIAAAEGNNEIGICGVAFNSRIMPVKMLQSSGSGNSSDLAIAIEYASDNGATVINMSLGSYGESLTVKSVLENAYAGTGSGGGSMLVAAAGNDRKKLVQEGMPAGNMFPACYSFIIGVQATGQSGGLADFSNVDPSGPIEYRNQWGYQYEMRAPGTTIISCKPSGSYWSKNGTSMASPEITGAVALIRQHSPGDSGEEIFAKLIQGSNSGLVNISNSLGITLVPNLVYVDYVIVDTLPGCDGDGVVDAGENIQVYFIVKNAGGLVDSVWSKIRFAPFEDTAVATIIDSTSYIGDISTYATMTGLLDPLEIHIDPTTVNNRDIMFQLEIGAKNTMQIIQVLIRLTVTHGEKLYGIIPGLKTLSNEKHYIVTDNVVFDSLIINPGVEISISPQKTMIINTFLLAEGKYDSLISFKSNGLSGWYGMRYFGTPFSTIKYSEFHSFTDNFLQGNINIENCIFIEGNGAYLNYLLSGYTRESTFTNNVDFSYDIYGEDYFENNICTNNHFIYGNNSGTGLYTSFYYYQFVRQNVSFHNLNGQREESFSASTWNWGIYKFAPNYYGTIDSTQIENQLIDFFEYNALAVTSCFDSALIQPPSQCHGIVWKILINSIEINKYDHPYNSTIGLGVIGAQTLKFDVCFNRSMDTTYTPLLTFGVREPYTQHIVADSASWSSDSTIWTAYKTTDMTTGDGIQHVRVANARDDEYFEIPIENSRFEFVIQAAAAASIEFYATPGIGKVELEWPPTPSDDALGYNLYRSYNLTDSTYSDTLMINTELILDTVHTDYNVIPDTTYHYFYKTLGTDMLETDYSKKVTATPFNAANGDANGDLEVNVLDITTVVAYMLNQSPNPFLFDAADVNYDNEINVLDIIGLVGLINGKKSMSTQPLPEISKESAYYYFNDNKVGFESKGNVAALQFKLKVRSEKLKMKKNLDKFRIFSIAQGFEFAYSVVGDEIIGILYSLSGRELHEGITNLFRFEGVDVDKIEITEIFGGDLSGNYVPILKKGTSSNVFSTDAELQASPNPFTFSTQINYTVPENGIVEIRLFDLKGTEINKLESAFQNAGKHSINWNGTNDNGQQLKSGIYLLQLKVKSVSGNSYNKETKVVLIK